MVFDDIIYLAITNPKLYFHGYICLGGDSENNCFTHGLLQESVEHLWPYHCYLGNSGCVFKLFPNGFLRVVSSTFDKQEELVDSIVAQDIQ